MSVKRAGGIGVSRTLFYRLRRRLELYGTDGVHPKRGQAQRGRPPAVPVQASERRVMAHGPGLGRRAGTLWISDELAREGVANDRDDNVDDCVRRQQLGTRRARLAVLERASAATTGLLTERTAKAVRHVEADRTGRPGVAAIRST